MPHFKARRIAKWTLTALAVLVCTAWIGNYWYAGCVSFRSPRLDFRWQGGQLTIWISYEGRYADDDRWQFFPVPKRARYFSWKLSYSTGKTGNLLVIPGWAPLLLVGLPAAYFWRRDILATRRERVGLCPKCNYDRRGLDPAAACPECGEKR